MTRLLNKPLLIPVLIYILSVFIVWPFGNFPVNDDYLFYLQIRNFLNDDFAILSSIDPSIISHVLLGYIWSLVFGLTHTSLRILSIILATLSILFSYKISLYISGSIKKSIAASLLVAVNPIFFISSLTFMTEISFLFFSLGSIYFFLSKNESGFRIYISLFFALLAFLVRQPGAILFLVYGLHFLFIAKNRNYKDIILIILMGILSVGIWQFWPRYSELGTESGISDLASKLVEFKHFKDIFLIGFYSLLYIPYFLVPVSLSIKHRVKLWHLPFVLVFAYFYYAIDIFSAGNVFYLEGLYMKSDFRHTFSLFDNFFFRSSLALLVSYSLLNILINFRYLELTKRIYKLRTLGLLLAGFTLVNFIGNDLYERYFLLTFVLFIILYVGICSGLRPLLFSITLSFAIFINLVLVHAYYTETSIKWDIVYKLQEKTGLISQIHLSGVYARYMKGIDTQDFTGDLSSSGDDYLCFIEAYSADSTSFIFNKVKKLNDGLNEVLGEPKPSGVRKIKNLSRAKNNLDKMIYNVEYKTPLYMFAGKNSYVGAWCSDDFAKNI